MIILKKSNNKIDSTFLFQGYSKMFGHIMVALSIFMHNILLKYFKIFNESPLDAMQLICYCNYL